MRYKRDEEQEWGVKSWRRERSKVMEINKYDVSFLKYKKTL